MTTVTVEQFRQHPERYLAQAAEGDVVLTLSGQPWIVLRTVDDDQERLSSEYAASPEFQQMISERRRETPIPWNEAKQQLNNEP